jgi:short-subunit dehydrogenase
MSEQGTAVVTGASSGIGAEYARRVAGRGYDVVLVARRGPRLEELATELRATGVAVEVVVADLAEPADVERVGSRVGAGDVSLLVNNAGINGYGPFEAVDPAVVAAVLAVNVTALTLLTHAAVVGMRARGRGAVVNVASLLAFAGALPPDPLPARATYGGSKGYVVTFSRTLAAELQGSGVTVQVLCPGRTTTEFHVSTDGRPVADDAGSDAPDPRAMSAQDVVRASLVGLDAGEVLVAPGLLDDAAVQVLVAAEAGLRSASVPDLAPRYRA